MGGWDVYLGWGSGFVSAGRLTVSMLSGWCSLLGIFSETLEISQNS